MGVFFNQNIFLFCMKTYVVDVYRNCQAEVNLMGTIIRGLIKVAYSKTSMAQTSLGPWKFIQNMGSLTHRGLIMASGQEANGDNLRKSF